jgi:hypothetical protein
MNLFLHVRLIEDRFHFSKPLEIPNATYTDIDNFSEAVVIDICLKAIDNADKLLVYFEGEAHHELGSVMRLFNKMRQYKKPMKIVYHGSHPIVDKLLKRFEPFLDNRKLDIEEIAEEFLVLPLF